MGIESCHNAEMVLFAKTLVLGEESIKALWLRACSVETRPGLERWISYLLVV